MNTLIMSKQDLLLAMKQELGSYLKTKDFKEAKFLRKIIKTIKNCIKYDNVNNNLFDKFEVKLFNQINYFVTNINNS